MNATGNNDRENVLAATDLVRLIGEHVQLRPKGREFAGLCPFHDDKNPSMQVSPQKQIYKCFSCGAGGTCFDFVMGYHKLTFPEALKMLADRAGIELTPFKAKGQGDRGQGGGGNADRRKRLLGVNELALVFFQEQLASPAGEQARDYLAKRGVSAEMIERFQLGYAPHSWHALAEAVTDKRWDKPAFENAGLIAQGQRGLYDKLRHRLVFPIGDRMGRPIAFGGRTLPGNELDDPTVDAKYLNSPETLLFNKSRTLYGLHLAQRAIGQTKTAVIVEGYTDVIACHQHGRCNVIAALGTAFTPEHATELRRICDKVVLVFDGDAAGHKAADRAVQVLLTSEIDAAVVMLPDGQDPDELLSSDGGAEAWDALIDGAQDTMRYLLDRFERELNDSDTITGRERAAEAFLTMLARHNVGSTPGVRRSLVLAQVAQMLHMPEQEVLAELKRLKPRAFTPTIPDQASMDQTDAEPVDAGLADGPESYETAEPSIPVSASVRRAIAVAQSQLVACLLRDNNLFHTTLPDGADFCEAVAPGDVVGEAGRVFQLLHDRFADGQALTLAGLLVELAERGWDHDRRWLTQADVDLDPQVGDDPARLERVFREAAQAICRHRQRRAFEDDRRAVVSSPLVGADPLALAGQAARLLEQRRNQPDPGRIARGAT